MARAVAAGLGTLVAVAAFCGTASAGAFHPTHRYDCYASQAVTGGRVYVVSYHFKSGNPYSEGFRPTKRTGLSNTFSSGPYKVAGKRNIGLSGQLKKDHERLLIQRADLAPLKPDGSFSGLGCYDTAKRTDQGGGGNTDSGSGGFPVGKYNCYHTARQTNGSYSQTFSKEVDFYADARYLEVGSSQGHWKQAGNTISFTDGPLWSDPYTHDVATWYPGGTAMPNSSGSFAGNQYTLVIRSTRDGENDPPMTEYSGAVPTSYDYCKPQ
jgi:hypothetical protein